MAASGGQGSAARQTALMLLLSAAILLTYIDRGAVSIAAPKMNAELGLDAAQFGLLVSLFFYPYTLMQLVVGWLCDRFSVYRLFSWGVALWALSTLLTGFVQGFAMLVVLRLLLGLGESICFPGASKIIALEVPAHRRGIANAALVTGIALGPAAGTLFGGLLLAEGGWRSIFLVFGGVTLLWLAPWLYLTRGTTNASRAVDVNPMPMRRLLGFRALWAVSLGHFCGNFVIYFIIAWLPLYLTTGRGLSIGTMTALATMTFLAQGIAAVLAGLASDRWTRSGRSEGMLRRMMCVGGSLVIVGGIIGIATTDNVTMLALWLAVTGAAAGTVSTNIFSLAQIFAGPALVGRWVGVQNFFANFAGILAPMVTGLMIARTGNYQAAFYLAAAVALVGAVAWAWFMPRVAMVSAAEPVPAAA